jgi:hypothetical protein
MNSYVRMDRYEEKSSMSPVLKELLETCGLTANPCAASCVRRSRWPEMPLKSLAVVLFNVKSRDLLYIDQPNPRGKRWDSMILPSTR